MLLALLLGTRPLAIAETSGDPATVPAALYRVEIPGSTPPRVLVQATLPSRGRDLLMTESWPGDAPEVAEGGWPALVRNLKVLDAEGREVAVTGNGPSGWTLERAIDGPLSVEYEIDFAPLAAAGWPAQREAAFADGDHLIACGRALFVTTPVQAASEVRFSLPPGWRAAVPWFLSEGDSPGGTVPSPEDLTENLLAFSSEAPEVLTAQGFTLQVVTLGHWAPARGEVQRVLGLALPELVSLTGFQGRAGYLVVLLPQMERGGESFRASFAMNLDTAPDRTNLDNWGHTIAHEVFHYWNGWRLVGTDYASSQWFQEGFTEYAASLALVSGGLIDREGFSEKLASHVTRYRKLSTPLDTPGTRKGPPLYSGGALVAFIWDTMIRETTEGERGIGDLLRELLRLTDEGSRSYAWADIQTALENTAPGPWLEFQERYIHGTDPLPIAGALARVGLRLDEGPEGIPRVVPDPGASAEARRRLDTVMGRKP